jgi:hypothetical protein
VAASARRFARALSGVAGALWALPLTAPMLVVGLLAWPFGARFAVLGPMVVVTRFPFGPLGALALGQVVLSRLPSLDLRVPSYRARDAARQVPPSPWHVERVHLGRHELAHVRQALVLGPLFPLAYLLSGGVSARNRFERAADRYARSGRGWWPEW